MQLRLYLDDFNLIVMATKEVVQHPISSAAKHLRALTPRLYQHCSHPQCHWQQAHWSVQDLIGTSSAERWKITEGTSGLLSSGKTTSAANSAAMLWKRGPASISVQVRYFQFNIVWFKLWFKRTGFDIFKKAPHSSRVLTAVHTYKKLIQLYVQY